MSVSLLRPNYASCIEMLQLLLLGLPATRNEESVTPSEWLPLVSSIPRYPQIPRNDDFENEKELSLDFELKVDLSKKPHCAKSQGVSVESDREELLVCNEEDSSSWNLEREGIVVLTISKEISRRSGFSFTKKEFLLGKNKIWIKRVSSVFASARLLEFCFNLGLIESWNVKMGLLKI